METHPAAVRAERRNGWIETMTAFVATSLRRAPSGMTAEQQQANLDRLLAELWHRRGAVVVMLDDYRIPGEVRMACEAIGRARYGKRRGVNAR